MSVFLVTFNSTMIASLMDQFQQAWNLDYSYSLLFKQAIAVSMIVFSLICVAFSDRYGKKRSMMIGLVIVAVTSVLCVLTKSFETIIMFRFFTGLGISLIAVSSLSIITDVTKKDNLLEVIAMSTSASCIGAISAPMLGLIWAETFGVMTVFLLPVPICLLCLFVFRDIDNTISKPDLKIDPILHLLFICGSFLILRALFNTQLERRFLIESVGILLFICFIIMNHYSKNKIFDAKIFRIKPFTISLIIGVMFSFITYSIDDTISGYLQIVDGNVVLFGITMTLVTIAAFVSGLKPFIQAVFAPIVAKWNKRHPTIDFSLVGFLIISVPVVLMFVVLTVSNLFDLAILSIVIYIALAVGSTQFSPTNKKAMMSSVPQEDRNFASSMTMIVSPVSKVVGVIFLLNLLDGNTTRETYSESGLTLAWMVATVFIIGAVIILLRAHCRKRHTDVA